MDSNIIEQAKQFWFVALWWAWLMRYQDDSSETSPPAPPYPHLGWGYRAGQFWPRGAHKGDHTDDWGSFFDRMAVEHGFSAISIDALYCYERYSSCRRFVDSRGTDYQFPR